MDAMMGTFAQGPNIARNEYGVRAKKQQFIKSEDKSKLLQELTENKELEADDTAQAQGKIPQLPRGPRQLSDARQRSASK
jgi:hypothetical protein